jgi:hypothetical protein
LSACTVFSKPYTTECEKALKGMGGNGERKGNWYYFNLHNTSLRNTWCPSGLYTSKQHPVTAHRDELNRLWEYIYVLLNDLGRWQDKKKQV